MDFPDMLASSIHDIKNSLGVVSNNLAILIGDPETKFSDPQRACLLQHEVQRVNNNLIQLLNLYKLGENALMLDICEHQVEDLLEEVVVNNEAICKSLGVTLDYGCDPELSGYFDLELLRGVLESTIGNAQRYATSRIHLDAKYKDDYLVIQVEDDGAGFPPELLKVTGIGHHMIQMLNVSGRTRLGLLFAEKISRLHRTKERTGFIRIENGCTLGGGCFQIWLP